MQTFQYGNQDDNRNGYGVMRRPISKHKEKHNYYKPGTRKNSAFPQFSAADAALVASQKSSHRFT